MFKVGRSVKEEVDRPLFKLSLDILHSPRGKMQARSNRPKPGTSCRREQEEQRRPLLLLKIYLEKFLIESLDDQVDRSRATLAVWLRGESNLNIVRRPPSLLADETLLEYSTTPPLLLTTSPPAHYTWLLQLCRVVQDALTVYCSEEWKIRRLSLS